MTLDEATEILRRQDGDYHEWVAAGSYVVSFYNEHRDRLKPVPWAKSYTTDAGAKPMRQADVSSKQTDRPPLRERQKDLIALAARAFRATEAKATRDAERGPDWAAELDRAQNQGRTRDAETSPSGMGGYSFPSSEQTPMGANPSTKVGGEPVQRLGGELGQWYIGKNDDGEVWLFKHVTANNLQNMGVTRDAFVKFGRQSEKRQQNAMKSVATQVRDFWKRHADAA